MELNIPISQIMTSELVTVTPGTTMDKVDSIFKANNIHHIPVVEDGEIKGIISKSDCACVQHGMTLFKNRHVEEYNKSILRSLLAEDIMTKKLATLRPEDSISMAASYFKENLFHAIPVVKNKQLIGIITPLDLIAYCFKGYPTLAIDQ